jgi:hypothetical protein
MRVRMLQRLRHGARDVAHGKLAFAIEPLPEALTVHHRHGVPQKPSGFARIVDGQNVGVGELGRDPNLLDEPLAQRRGELGVEHLERHRAIVTEVVGKIDRPHPASAERTLDPVAVAQGGL